MADENTKPQNQLDLSSLNSPTKPTTPSGGIDEILKDMPPKLSVPASAPSSLGATTPPRPTTPQNTATVPKSTQPYVSQSEFTPKPLAGQSFPPSIKPVESLKTEIRTMKDDIAALQKGKSPSGLPVEIKPEITSPQPILKEVPQFSPPQQSSSLKASLGGVEKSKALSDPSALPLRPIPSVPSVQVKAKPEQLTPPISVPKQKAGLNKTLVWGIVVFIILGGGAYLFIKRQTPELVTSPISTNTPILAVLKLEQFFPDFTSFFLQINPENQSPIEDPKTALNSNLGLTGLNLERFSAFSMSTDALTNAKVDFATFVSLFEIVYPMGFLETLDLNEWILLVYGQSEFFDNGVQKLETRPTAKNNFIVKVKDEVALRSALNIWETTLSEDLTYFFSHSRSKASSPNFIENIYQGIVIRYMNFPDPDFSIDYSVVRAKNGGVYLVFSSSRESMYKAIDTLLGVSRLGI